jgi:addiction module HigA family antidote
MGISRNKLARDIGVSTRRINETVHGKCRVTADRDLRLVKYFGMSPKFWRGLQMNYELDLESDRLGKRLDSEVGRNSQAA